MKETLFTILALCGLAAGAETLQTITLGTIDASLLVPTTNTVEEAYIVFGTDQTTSSVGAHSTFISGSFAPNANVDSGTPWTLTTTVTNTSNVAFSLNTVDLSVYSFNGSGNRQVNNRNVVLTLQFGDEAAAASRQFLITGNQSTPTVCTLGSQETPMYTLGAGETVTMKITASQGDAIAPGRGSFFGLTQMTVTGTPEPATATLSLLALAGLAVRRRRH